MKEKIILGTIIFIHCYIFTGCTKDWLEIKSDKSLVVPETLKDMELLLNNYVELNTTSRQSAEVLMEIGSDNYFYTDQDWAGVQSNPNNISGKNAFAFNTDIFEGKTSYEWNNAYKRIGIANIVLEGLRYIDSTKEDIDLYRTVLGRALFIRAHALQSIAETFALPYDPANSNEAPGIPVRSGTSLAEITPRSTQQQSYSAIVKDLVAASSLLPRTDISKTRPSAGAAFALLARVYLNMHLYDSALLAANKCLEIPHNLIDYNTLPGTAANPFPQFNDEVLYHAHSVAGLVSTGKIDTVLYGKYQEGDLRKILFFAPVSGTGYFTFKGNYGGSRQLFCGLAIDEVYLIKAECMARSGDFVEAMAVLNTLIRSRWSNESVFIDLTAADANDALDIILVERRKQLLFRGTRWMDLRRLNMEGANIVVNHGTTENIYSLQPGSNKYAYPIPPDVINFTGMAQNER